MRKDARVGNRERADAANRRESESGDATRREQGCASRREHVRACLITRGGQSVSRSGRVVAETSKSADVLRARANFYEKERELLRERARVKVKDWDYIEGYTSKDRKDRKDRKEVPRRRSQERRIFEGN